MHGVQVHIEAINHCGQLSQSEENLNFWNICCLGFRSEPSRDTNITLHTHATYNTVLFLFFSDEHHSQAVVEERELTQCIEDVYKVRLSCCAYHTSLLNVGAYYIVVY